MATESQGHSPPAQVELPEGYFDLIVAPVMSLDHVRKIVSGGKARFIEPETATNLDLVYGAARTPYEFGRTLTDAQ